MIQRFPTRLPYCPLMKIKHDTSDTTGETIIEYENIANDIKVCNGMLEEDWHDFMGSDHKQHNTLDLFTNNLQLQSNCISAFMMPHSAIYKPRHTINAFWIPIFRRNARYKSIVVTRRVSW